MCEQYPPLAGTTIVAIILLTLHLVDTVRVRHHRTHDIVVTLMLNFPRRYSGTVWGAIWLFVSIILGIILPIWMGKTPEWIFTTPGIVVTINFSFLVPMLVLSYVALAREVDRFFRRENLDRLGLREGVFTKQGFIAYNRVSLCVFRIFMFVGALFVVWYGISAVTESVGGVLDEDCFRVPWVDRVNLNDQGNNCQLNWIGLVYYVIIRGINTYMALGLLLLSLLLFVAFFFGLQSEPGGKFIRGGSIGRAGLDRFVLRLAACVLFAPAVVFVHGLALFFESKMGIVSIAGRGVWLFWMVGSLFGTYLVLAIITWFYTRVRAAERYIRDQLCEDIEADVLDRVGSRDSYREMLERASSIEAFLQTIRPRTSINVSLSLGAGSAVVQTIGIGVAAIQGF